MKFSLILSFILILQALPGQANGMWAKSTDSELIANSDIIALAKLTGRTTRISSTGETLHLGILTVREILKGGKEKKVLLLILPSPDGPVKSTDIQYHDGQDGLWLLMKSKGNEDLYRADHPQRFIPVTNTELINALLNILKTTTEK